jgi:hypothetical protein
MATGRNYKRAKPSLEDRFEFIGDAVAPGDREALRSAMFEVEDRLSGVERCLKLWRKTGTPVDEDLRQLWLHEMRQVQRVMSYAGARDVIVDVLEFVEDDEDFGVVLERVGQPLSEKRKRVSPARRSGLDAPPTRHGFYPMTGDEFRDHIAALLRIRYEHVQTEVKLTAKKADICFEIQAGPRRRIKAAAECKRWGRALTRDHVKGRRGVEGLERGDCEAGYSPPFWPPWNSNLNIFPVSRQPREIRPSSRDVWPKPAGSLIWSVHRLACHHAGRHRRPAPRRGAGYWQAPQAHSSTHVGGFRQWACR